MRIDPRKLPPMPEIMIAGPGELHEEDLEVLGHQVIAHYGDVWTQLHDQTVADVGRLVGAADAPYIVPGTGTAMLDASVANLFEPGQKVAVANTGFFGIRLMEIARQHRLEVVEVPVEVGAAVDPERIRAAAQGCDGILTVHVETATGVRHPVREIAEVAADLGAVYMVDGIASIGGEHMDVDGWGIGSLITSTQKGLEAPPGLGILALGASGRERVKARREPPRTWYLDLNNWDWYRREWGSWHPHPVTMPTNLVMALSSSIARILEAGIDSWVARRAELARKCREGLVELGLQPVPAAGVEANLVVAVWADDPAMIQKHLLVNEQIMISGGLTPTAGKAIRVGLMGGTATDAMVDRVLSGVKGALS